MWEEPSLLLLAGITPWTGAYSIEWRMGADTSDLSLFLIVDHSDQLRQTFVVLTLLPKSWNKTLFPWVAFLSNKQIFYVCSAYAPLVPSKVRSDSIRSPGTRIMFVGNHGVGG